MAKSSRTKHHSPNIAQFPARGEEGTRFKPVIGVPGNDWYIMNMDFSGIQLRIAAFKSGDPNMIDAFVNQSGDLHSVSAQAIFTPDMPLTEFLKVKDKQPYKDFRQKAKCFVAGTKIRTSLGDVSIESFVPELNSGFFTPFLREDFHVVNRHGDSSPIESSYFQENVKETFEILLDNGDRIEVTGDHKFPVLRGSIECVVRAEDLLPGDKLIQVD